MGAEGFSTKAAGGSVPLGLVAAALFLVLFVWGCRERKRGHWGEHEAHTPSLSRGRPRGALGTGPRCRLR